MSTFHRPIASSEVRAALANRRILIVDDDDDSRELLKVVLVSCGAHVYEANSADEAFDTVKQHSSISSSRTSPCMVAMVVRCSDRSGLSPKRRRGRPSR
jgi:CheY-like chemotaxis protein